jgi:hypothetical protein
MPVLDADATGKPESGADDDAEYKAPRSRKRRCRRSARASETDSYHGTSDVNEEHGEDDVKDKAVVDEDVVGEAGEGGVGSAADADEEDDGDDEPVHQNATNAEEVIVGAPHSTRNTTLIDYCQVHLRSDMLDMRARNPGNGRVVFDIENICMDKDMSAHITAIRKELKSVPRALTSEQILDTLERWYGDALRDTCIHHTQGRSRYTSAGTIFIATPAASASVDSESTQEQELKRKTKHITMCVDECIHLMQVAEKSTFPRDVV